MAMYPFNEDNNELAINVEDFDINKLGEAIIAERAEYNRFILNLDTEVPAHLTVIDALDKSFTGFKYINSWEKREPGINYLPDWVKWVTVGPTISVSSSEDLRPHIFCNGSILFRNVHRVIGLTSSGWTKDITKMALLDEIVKNEGKTMIRVIEQNAQGFVYRTKDFKEIKQDSKILAYVDLNDGKWGFAKNKEITKAAGDSRVGGVVLFPNEYGCIIFSTARFSDDLDTTLEYTPLVVLDDDYLVDIKPTNDHSENVKFYEECATQYHENMEIGFANGINGWAFDRLKKYFSTKLFGDVCNNGIPLFNQDYKSNFYYFPESFRFLGEVTGKTAVVWQFDDTDIKDSDLNTFFYGISKATSKYGQFNSISVSVYDGNAEQKAVQTFKFIPGEDGFVDNGIVFNKIMELKNELIKAESGDWLVIESWLDVMLEPKEAHALGLKCATKKSGISVNIKIPNIGFDMGYSCGETDTGNADVFGVM